MISLPELWSEVYLFSPWNVGLSSRIGREWEFYHLSSARDAGLSPVWAGTVVYSPSVDRKPILSPSVSRERRFITKRRLGKPVYHLVSVGHAGSLLSIERERRFITKCGQWFITFSRGCRFINSWRITPVCYLASAGCVVLSLSILKYTYN